MGKTPKPLTILAHPDQAEALAPYIAKGHTVHWAWTHFSNDHPLTNYDLILLPNARKMNKNLEKYIAIAIEDAWNVKYPRKAKATPDTEAGEPEPEPVGGDKAD